MTTYLVTLRDRETQTVVGYYNGAWTTDRRRALTLRPIVEGVLTCVSPNNWCATRPRLTASSAAARRLDLLNEGQAIDRSDLGCGQLLELVDLGIDPRHDFPRYSHCRLRWRGIRDGNGADQG